MQIIDTNPKDVLSLTANLGFKSSKVALLIYNLADPKSFKALRNLTETLYYNNPEVYTILVGTHKDLPRQVPIEEVEWFENFYFIDHSFEISTFEKGMNECEAALKLSAALVFKNINESEDKKQPIKLRNYNYHHQ
jgi:GTPase SAR1 family protein